MKTILPFTPEHLAALSKKLERHRFQKLSARNHRNTLSLINSIQNKLNGFTKSQLKFEELRLMAIVASTELYMEVEPTEADLFLDKWGQDYMRSLLEPNVNRFEDVVLEVNHV